MGVVQRVELTMIQTTYTTRVTTLETKDGCPLGPGGNLQKEVDPLAHETLSDNQIFVSILMLPRLADWFSFTKNAVVLH